MLKDNTKKSREIKDAYENKKYIVADKKVYQPFYSVNAGYYAHCVYTDKDMLTIRGRFYHFSGDTVNQLIGIKLLRNL